MITGSYTNTGAQRQRILTDGETATALGPYLMALRMVRAELLAQEIQGERASTEVDAAIDGLLDRFYAGVQKVYYPGGRMEAGAGD